MKKFGALFAIGAFATTCAAVGVAAEIHGRVIYEGRPLAAEPIRLELDAGCVGGRGPTAPRQDFLVGEASGLKNVMIYVKGWLRDPPEAPGSPVSLKDVNCLFEPRVLGIMTGQKLEITNDTRSMHLLDILCKKNGRFNVGHLPGQKIETDFRKPELAIAFKCDVHPWEKGYLYVFDHPYFGVTRDDGTCQFASPPPGKYTLTAWHEVLGAIEQPLVIGSDDPAPVVFVFRDAVKPPAPR